jgi:acyl-CoA thioester hydrolase
MITGTRPHVKPRYGQAMVTNRDTPATEATEAPGATESSEATGFIHRVRVRYGDCDMQGVVFNPNYFAYVDDAMDTWLETSLGGGGDYLEHFDYVVKKASMEWFSAARARDVIDLRPVVTRWGRSSFEVHVRLDVGSRPVARADLVLISVKPGTHDPLAVPEDVRQALS